MRPLSCITTCFNEGPLLARAVKSVLSQSFEDFQYIIVDDGADRATRAVLAEINDPRVLLIRQPNAGLSVARNRALAQATGRYVCFLDGDDSRPAWAFQALLAAACEGSNAHRPADLVLGRGVLATADGHLGRFYDDARFARIAALTAAGRQGTARALAALIEPQSANKLVRRSLLEQGTIAFPAGRCFEDIHFHVATLSYARRVAFLQTPCFAYYRRYGRAQITATRGARLLDILPVVEGMLALFARRPGFVEPLARATVLAAGLKMMDWCARRIAPSLGAEFRRRATGLLRALPPGFADALLAVDPGLDPALPLARRALLGWRPELAVRS